MTKRYLLWNSSEKLTSCSPNILASTHIIEVSIDTSIRFESPILLKELHDISVLEDAQLLRSGSRLSVMPVTNE